MYEQNRTLLCAHTHKKKILHGHTHKKKSIPNFKDAHMIKQYKIHWLAVKLNHCEFHLRKEASSGTGVSNPT
jgi:hypothetical protein